MTPNRDEQLVIDSLRHQGYKKIIFEPDGNVPPDILINESIAIEVRRLNQNQITKDGFKGLEQDDYSIYGILKRVLRDVSEENYDKSAFVGYYFGRPIPPNKEIKKRITEVLKNHKPFITEKREYVIHDNIRLKIFPSEKKLDQQFKYGMSSDRDSGGFVIGLIYENLKLIISEKEEKTKRFIKNHPKWWLAVVDEIGLGLSDLDFEQFNNFQKIDHSFDRILLVSSLDYKSFRYLFE